MKYCIPSGLVTNTYLENNCEWVEPIEFIEYRKAIINNPIKINGWILESDDSFDSYFVLVSGIQIPKIFDSEYSQLSLDNIAFLSKTRFQEFRKLWKKFSDDKY